ncbi:Aspartate 1-decarboxylase [Thermodesulfobium narugense DSM 14796]|uniref:Aspartate 1-decarboxylase n=1 Tax=Thermodesulfobium narugense DSM 14796 TaxID=747365 RepID=M1E7N9_9BACT|nr:aspartate 1-decarboxylase [Thermodesulfobium narugense]AEE14084.1 Aspartate 1-decarboxylase [Thermodesulfobium narugense DSM 14796]
MYIKMLKSKIHRARVTDTNLNYEGSISIDKALLDESGIVPGQAVSIFNLNNGKRFETYVIEGERNSGKISLNGAAARLAEPGDLVIIVAYCWIDEKELKDFVTKIVHVDEKNKIV